jgi:sister chromatid cohesion protein PDS5
LSEKLREINQSEDGGQLLKLPSALAHAHVLKHNDREVSATVSVCVSEVFRIFAPEQPYEKEETLATVYEGFNETLGGLKYARRDGDRNDERDDDAEDDYEQDNDDDDEEDDVAQKQKQNKNKKNKKMTTKKSTSSSSSEMRAKKQKLFEKAERLLRNIAQYGLCVPILDLEDKQTSVELARGLFEQLFDCTTAKTEAIVGENVAKVLHTMIEEASEDTMMDGGGNNISSFHDEVLEQSPLLPEILESTLSRLIEPKRSKNPSAFALSSSMIKLCSTSLHVPTQKFLVKSFRGLVPKEHALYNLSKRHADILETLASVDASVLLTLWPELIEEAKSEDVAQRVKACKLVGRALRSKSSSGGVNATGTAACIADDYPHVLKSFCQRFQDKDKSVRVFCCEWALKFLNNAAPIVASRSSSNNKAFKYKHSSQESDEIESDNDDADDTEDDDNEDDDGQLEKQVLPTLLSSTTSSQVVITSRLAPTRTGETNAAAMTVFRSLRDRCKDTDEHVRLKATEALLDVFSRRTDHRAVRLDDVKSLANSRMRDTKATVRKVAFDGVVKCYRNYAARCMKTPGALTDGEGKDECERFDWVPGSILKCIAIQDVNVHVIDPVLAKLFPQDFPVDTRSMFWLRALMMSGSSANSTKADDEADDDENTNAGNAVEPHTNDCLRALLMRRANARADFAAYMDARELAKNTQGKGAAVKTLETARKYFSEHFKDPKVAAEKLKEVETSVKDQKFFESVKKIADFSTSSKAADAAAEDAKKRLGHSHTSFNIVEALIAKVNPAPFNREYARSTLKLAYLKGKKPAKGRIDEATKRLSLFAIDHAVMLAKASGSIFENCGDRILEALKNKESLVDELVLGYTRLFSISGRSLSSTAETRKLRDLLLETIDNGESGWTRSKLSARALVQLAMGKSEDGENTKALATCFSNLLDAMLDGRDAEMPDLLASASAMPAALVFQNLDDVEKALFTLVKNKASPDNLSIAAIKCLRNYASLTFSCEMKKDSQESVKKARAFKQRSAELFADILKSSSQPEVLSTAALAIVKIASGLDGDKAISANTFYAVAKFLCDNDDDDETKIAFIGKVSKYANINARSTFGIRWHAIVAALSGDSFDTRVRNASMDAWKLFVKQDSPQRKKFDKYLEDAQKLSKNTEEAKQKQSFALLYSPEYTLIYLIHLLSRIEPGVKSAKEEDDDLTEEDLRFSEDVFDQTVNALWPAQISSTSEEYFNSRVGATLKLVRSLKTCEDTEDADGKSDALYVLTDLCLASCSEACKKRGLQFIDDRSSENIGMNFTARYPVSLFHVVGKRVSGKPLEVGGPPRVGDYSHLPRAYLKYRLGSGGPNKRKNTSSNRASKKRHTTTSTHSNAKVTDTFLGKTTTATNNNNKKQKAMKQTTLKMPTEAPTRAMPKRKATGEAIIVDEMYDSDDFDPDSPQDNRKKKVKLLLPAPADFIVAKPKALQGGLKSRSTNTTSTTGTNSKSSSLKQKNVTSFFGARENSDVENVNNNKGAASTGRTTALELALVDPIKRGNRRRR